MNPYYIFRLFIPPMDYYPDVPLKNTSPREFGMSKRCQKIHKKNRQKKGRK